MTLSIIGAWQVFANVGISFERMNIFTCGKKQMVAGIKAVTGGGLGPGQGPNNSISIVYTTISIIGAWQVFANVAIQMWP